MPRYANVYDRNLTKGFDEILYYVNDVTESLVSNLILVGIYIIILYGVFKNRNDFLEAMSVSGFVTFIIAVLFWLAGFISGYILVFVLAVAILSFAILWFNKI